MSTGLSSTSTYSHDGFFVDETCKHSKCSRELYFLHIASQLTVELAADLRAEGFETPTFGCWVVLPILPRGLGTLDLLVGVLVLLATGGLEDSAALATRGLTAFVFPAAGGMAGGMVSPGEGGSVGAITLEFATVAVDMADRGGLTTESLEDVSTPATL